MFGKIGRGGNAVPLCSIKNVHVIDSTKLFGKVNLLGFRIKR